MITFEMLETEVRRLAAENPDFIYPQPPDNDIVKATCFYNATGPYPACIFGQALANLGHPVHPDFEEWGITRILIVKDMAFSLQERLWMRAVQEAQDAGACWAQAVIRADVRREAARLLMQT